MGNRADDEGSDVEIFIRALTDTVHADTPTGAPEELHALLDQLGFERNTVKPAGSSGPTYVWHEAPAHLSEAQKKQLATRAVPPLLMAGYIVRIPDYLFDPVAYRSATARIRAQRATPTAPVSTPDTSSRAGRSRRA